ncbi:MAG: hypothetical protein HY343_07790 [Lentisphaerae bacterium]|nr:hypothetical protein [Lentisphaerota bacterium]
MAVIGGLLCLVVLLVLPECRSRALVSKPAADSARNLKTPEMDIQKVYITVRPWREEAASPTPIAPRVSTPPPMERPVRGTAEAVLSESALKDESPAEKPRVKKPDVEPRTMEPEEAVKRNEPRNPQQATPDPPTPVAGKVERMPIYAGSAREIGRQLLGVDGKNEGAVPLITMDYRGTLGWPGYTREMLKLGGLFFIYDHRTQRIRAQVDVLHGTISPTAGDSLRGLSPRMREIQGEIAITDLMVGARNTLGAGDYALILLLPLNVDAELIGGLAKGLAARGIDIATVGHVIGEHETGRPGLRLRVQQVIDRRGAIEPVDFVVEKSAS